MLKDLRDVDKNLITYALLLTEFIKRFPRSAKKEIYFLDEVGYHSILCMSSTTLPYWSELWEVMKEGDQIVPAECCHTLWDRGMTPEWLSKQPLIKKALYMAKYYEGEESKEVDMTLISSKIYMDVRKTGYHKLNGRGYKLKEFLLETLIRYGRLNDGVPNFGGITNKRTFKIGEETTVSPLEKSGRMQLRLSPEWVQEKLPELYKDMMNVMRARKLYFSILYTEGVNYLRYSKEYKNAAFPLTADWIRDT